jgi:hypothetical protein
MGFEMSSHKVGGAKGRNVKVEEKRSQNQTGFGGELIFREVWPMNLPIAVSVYF